MPEETQRESEQEHKKNIAVVKSTRKSNLLSRLKDKFPQINKKLLILLLIILAIPLTVTLTLVQQELRSRASGGGDRKVFLGIANQTNFGFKINNCNADRNCIERDLEKIKSETGSYPSVYAVWANMDIDANSKNNLLNIFKYLDSKSISPALYLMPVSNKDMERRDGRFILSPSSPEEGVGKGELKFDSANPSQITKIYVSKTASGTDNPNWLLAPTWIKGETIELYGSKSNENINYDGSESFKFEIIADTVDVPPVDVGYWTISVKPIKTTPLTGTFTPGKPIFISPSNVFSQKYSNASIARGGIESLDSNFKVYAEIIKEYGSPVLLRYAHEMNGNWFPWSEGVLGKVNKNNPAFNSYGRQRYFDMGNTPANFVSSWKHIYSLMKSVTPDVKFYWCGAGGKPIGGYFPGDRYVDYVGFDVYSGINNDQHGELAGKISKNVDEINKVSNKPIIIGEIGINTDSKSTSNFSNYRKEWLKKGYEYIYNNYPRIVGIIYFNVDMRSLGEPGNNWVLWDSPEIASTYKSLLLDPRFQGRFGRTDVSVSTPTPTNPPVGTAGLLPYGYHDSASCTNITGWACDENDYDKSVAVKFYADSPAGEGKYLGSVIANNRREAAVGERCGGKPNHGFSFSIPQSIRDGQSHKIYAYAVDDTDSSLSNRLNTSPKVIMCSGTAVSPTPTPADVPSCRRVVPTITYLDTLKSGKKGESVIYKITFKNNDSGCSSRKAAFDLSLPTERWSFSPETVSVNSGETKNINLKVTSGPYATPGIKSLNLNIHGAYKPNTVFSTQELKYDVLR